ncbi:unnamed protein product [Chrysoparadoxa australica]
MISTTLLWSALLVGCFGISRSFVLHAAPAAMRRGRAEGPLLSTPDTPLVKILADEDDDSVDDIDPTEVASIIYKRRDETYDYSQYPGAYDESDDEDYIGVTPLNSEGKYMVRVVVVGGGAGEAKILSKLSAMEDEVCGTYVTWDEAKGLHEDMDDIPFLNFYRCEEPENAQQVADMASFIYAQIVILGDTYQGEENAAFVEAVKAAGAAAGVNVIGPGDAAAMAAGNMEAFHAVSAVASESLGAQATIERELQ